MLGCLKKYYKKLSIKQKLLLLFSVQVIIPMTFMGLMLYKNTENIIQGKSISYAADLLKMIELRMDDFSQDIEAITDDIMYDERVYAILEESVINSDLQEENLNNCYSMLRRLCLANSRVQSITLASLKGKFYSYDLNAGEANINENLPFKDMIATAREANHMPVWYMHKEGEHAQLYLIRMIYDYNTFLEKGIIIIKINNAKLEAVYSDFSKEFIQNIAILSQDNKMIAGSKQVEISEEEKEWIDSQQNNWNYKIDSHKQNLFVYMNIPGDPWKIVARGSMNQLVNKEMSRFIKVFILIMACTVLILSIFSILMAMDFMEPINRLVHGIKKVETENIHQEVLVDREDELGYLSKCFNKMSLEIDNLLNRVYKEELTRRESELKALQAQINPHFLFNTLESINWMAQLNHVPEIKDMVTSLASLMEASIGKGSPMVPLSKELKYIDSYLLIMKNRYGDRLTYESDIDRNILAYEVPKLILQPLIENAIYHGIDKMRKKGVIHLTIMKKEEEIYIEIMDNGKGMHPEEVEELNKSFKEDNHDYLIGTNRKSIGLANVNGRIKLFFGQEYGLQVESVYENYTKMKLNIPIAKLRRS